jgi:receptor expression-enhancing protein 5/6
MYWIIYGFFAVFEKFADLALGWLPLYFFFKLGFLVYCFLPQTKGALFIFNHVIDPILSKYEAQIDTGLKTLGAAAAKKIE